MHVSMYIGIDRFLKGDRNSLQSWSDAKFTAVVSSYVASINVFAFITSLAPLPLVEYLNPTIALG